MFKSKVRKTRELNDEELVRQLQQQMDAELFGVLYDRYVERVYQKCMALAGDRDLAKDLAHDVFLKVFANLSKFDHRSKFGTWLYRVTYNYCLDHLRKDKKVRKEDLDERVQGEVPDRDANEEALLSLRAERLSAVLDAMDARDKAVLLMKYQDEMSIQDMCMVLELGESAVKMRMLRARERAVDTYQQLYGERP
ncbi:MAG: RNA polymerase sigma factor [Flavobacteriales bacterium]|nr:RNA polymerase sigma factor [Flavobacteriales bacterium]